MYQNLAFATSLDPSLNILGTSKLKNLSKLDKKEESLKIASKFLEKKVKMFP